jgi:hypothetical protein
MVRYTSVDLHFLLPKVRPCRFHKLIYNFPEFDDTHLQALGGQIHYPEETHPSNANPSMPHNLKARISHYSQLPVLQLVREEEARADGRLRCSPVASRFR